MFQAGDKLLPGTKPGFLKSEKMLSFMLLYIQKSVSENICVNRIILMVDVVPYHFDTYLLADVIAKWKVLFHNWMGYHFSGRCQ